MINAPATTCEFRMKGSSQSDSHSHRNDSKHKNENETHAHPGTHGHLALADHAAGVATGAGAGAAAGNPVARQTQTTIDGLHTLPGQQNDGYLWHTYSAVAHSQRRFVWVAHQSNWLQSQSLSMWHRRLRLRLTMQC